MGKAPGSRTTPGHHPTPVNFFRPTETPEKIDQRESHFFARSGRQYPSLLMGPLINFFSLRPEDPHDATTTPATLLVPR